MYTFAKAFIAGSILEVKIYEKPIRYNHKNPTQTQSNNQEYTKTKPFSRKIADFRTKRRIRQLIYANSYQYFNVQKRPYKPVFITLTFADNIKSPKIANLLYTKFLKRLNYKLFNNKNSQLKYLTVIEFQKRGAVHYHSIFFNLPFINTNANEFISTIWDNGFIKINAINNIQHLSNYVIKYLTKAERDSRLDQKKFFFTSKKLIQPLEIYDKNIITSIINQLPKNLDKTETQYKTYTGETINYYRYKLPDTKSFNIKI